MRPQDVFAADRGVDLAKRLVICRTEKSHWRYKGAGADARNQREFGSLACLGQAVQYAGAESPIVAAARQHQPIRLALRASPLIAKPLFDHPLERRGRGIGPVPDIREARNLGDT